MTDAEVERAIARVREGGVDDYEVVVRAFQGRLRSVVANSCPPGLEPDEIAHLAFVEAFRKIDAYRPDTRFFAWLCTIARLILLSELRKLRREARSREHYLEAVAVDALEAELETGSELDELRVRALRGCLEALPEHLRQAVQLRYDRDASIDRISQRLGKSAGAVKVQLFDTRRKLRDCVNRKLAMQRG
ncbi:MAG: sigma-70 family RNA polymerase sigma factor [Planctomycetaceae bacterium]|nr:sigma-70 family RNA polymerase sigma factor [Planctomycetaceae bacterium]